MPFIQRWGFKPASLSERMRKPLKQLIDVYENSGFNREKKTLRGRVLVLTLNITQLITIILHKYWKNWLVHNILSLDKLDLSPTFPPPPGGGGGGGGGGGRVALWSKTSSSFPGEEGCELQLAMSDFNKTESLSF